MKKIPSKSVAFCADLGMTSHARPQRTVGIVDMELGNEYIAIFPRFRARMYLGDLSVVFLAGKCIEFDHDIEALSQVPDFFLRHLEFHHHFVEWGYFEQGLADREQGALPPAPGLR